MGCTNGTRLLVSLVFMIVILALSFIETAGQFDSPSASLPDTNSTSNGSQPMADSDDTVRVDPLDSFKKYRGGFDITNKHYWSSLVFTGVYGYAIGLLWLLCGILYRGYLLATAYCCKRNKKPKKKSLCHKQCYLWPIILAIIFMILVIAATGLALGGTARFHSKAKTVLKIIVRASNEATGTIYNTTGVMREIRDNLGETNGTAEASSFLTSTSQTLDSEAANIARETRKYSRLIDRVLKIAFIVTTVIISLNLVAVIALSVTGILRIRRALRWLIAICWVFTTLCWLFFGIYFFLGKFAGDTCTAIGNFHENPNNNSLNSILPCDELLSAEPVLLDVSAEIYNLVNEVNSNISQLATTYPNIPSVCNPFSAPPEYAYQPDNCPANTIRIADIPQILAAFACSDSNNGTCQAGQFISASDYRTVETYTTSVQSLLNAYPGMESVVECQSVKDAFSEIVGEHCRPLKRFAHISWAAMVSLSVTMVVLVLTWTAQACHDQALHSSDGSVKPQSSTPTNSLEFQANNEVIKDHSSKPNPV